MRRIDTWTKELTRTAGILGITLVTSLGIAFAQQAQDENTETKGENKNGVAAAPKTPGQNDPVLIVTTWQLASATGCWATLYDGHNYTGRKLTILGPRNLNDLEFPPYSDWEGDIDSLVVGPDARLVLYGGKNYQDRDFTFEEGRQEANLRHIPYWDSIESLKLECK